VPLHLKPARVSVRVERALDSAELESLKARYMDRLKRNQDGIAREKATFGAWFTVKQRESQAFWKPWSLFESRRPRAGQYFASCRERGLTAAGEISLALYFCLGRNLLL
jgi:hypothetical protein